MAEAKSETEAQVERPDQPCLRQSGMMAIGNQEMQCA